MVELVDQLPVIHKVAANYWQTDVNISQDAFNAIKIIKRNGGKVSGFLPSFSNYPSVFFKVYFYDKGFQFESDGLQAANNMDCVKGIRVPKIISILPEYRALLLEKRAWQDTDSELKRFFAGAMGFDFYTIGYWLRKFHDSKTSTIANEYFLKKKFQKINLHLQTLKSLFSPGEYDDIKEFIETSREKILTYPCKWVVSHGDFLLGNIRLSDSGMDIIDFEDSQMAPPEFDIVNFLARLEYTDYFPNRKGTYKIIRQQFLDGYEFLFDLSDPVYKIFYLFVKLDVIETYFRRRHFSDINLYHKWIYKYFELNGLKQLKSWLVK